jgi:large subunit ribosomal protein L27Ae
MRHYHKLANHYHCPSVNVDHLWHLVGDAVVKAARDGAKSGKAPVIDVTKFGYFKVLGNGRLPSIPLVVKARYVSKMAEAKIKAAGGAVQLTA